MIVDASPFIVDGDRVNSRLWALIKRAAERGEELHTTHPVLAQVWRDPRRHAYLARALRSFDVHALDDSVASPDGKTVRAEAERFLDILERHYGRRPIVYTTVDFYEDTGIGRLPKTEFWLRSVAGHPRNVYPKAVWRFWQYTGTGLVPGVQGRVDINAFNGSPDIWARWKAGAP